MARLVNCVKLGKEAEGLDFPPYPGELGKKIFENVSKEAWAEWLKHQTMLVNENRLSLIDPEARKYLTQQTENYFFGSGADQAEVTKTLIFPDFFWRGVSNICTFYTINHMFSNVFRMITNPLKSFCNINNFQSC